MKYVSFFIFLFFFASSFSQKLPNYSCFSNHFDIDKYVQQYDRKFDNAGIITQKDEYHALTISFYGIMACEAFKQTGDSTYYWHCINQYKYFQDTSKVEISANGERMGLPYHFNFGDLKAPWYSGMTQGAAISFLLRYYDLTKDDQAIKICKQLAAFMLRPENEGGTIGITPEGYQFIEEYPNSKSSEQVLNGFINGLIGLYEYLLFFPEDTLAQDIFKQSYDGMFAALRHYDTPSWTSYNRNKRNISNQYIRYQLAEFEHLYEIFGDIRFIEQMHLWGMMAFGKIDKTLIFYKNPSFQYSVPLKQKKVNDYTFLVYEPSTKMKEELFPITTHSKTPEIYKKSPVSFSTDKPVSKVYFSYFDSIDTSLISLSNIDRSSYRIHNDLNTKTVTIELLSKTADEIVLIYSKRWRRRALKTFNWKGSALSFPKYEAPFFLFTKEVFKVSKDKTYALNFESNNTPELKCYYRFAATKDQLNRVNWEITNQLDINNIQLPQDGFIEVMICYSANERNSYISTPVLVAK